MLCKRRKRNNFTLHLYKKKLFSVILYHSWASKYSSIIQLHWLLSLRVIQYKLCEHINCVNFYIFLFKPFLFIKNFDRQCLGHKSASPEKFSEFLQHPICLILMMKNSTIQTFEKLSLNLNRRLNKEDKNKNHVLTFSVVEKSSNLNKNCSWYFFWSLYSWN